MSEAARATRKLAEEFRQASDTKILKITRMIDQMPERGEADALLEPIRDRLASLRPSRRMTWTRLLFLPFDPVLVPASQWRPGQYALPRSALLPVTALLGWSAERGRGEPPLGEGADDEAMLPVAGPLWDDAAARLAVARPPEAWQDADWQKQTGLTVEALGAMLPAVRLVLANARQVRSLGGGSGADATGALPALLSAALSTGSFGWGLMLTLLFAVAPADEVARTAAGLLRNGCGDPALLGGVDRAIGSTLDRIEGRLGKGDNVDERLVLISQVDRLGKLDHRPPEEVRRVCRIRAELASGNRDLFGRMLAARLPDGRNGAAGAAEISDEAMLALEGGMRQLRAFALAASRLGDAAEYERLLERAAAQCGMADGIGGLSAVDRLRLVELLVGGERALRSCGT